MAILDSNKTIHAYFEDIAGIPHGSFNEKGISDYIETFVKARQLEYKRDEMHNMIVYKPASKGYEDHEGIMLQGHVDMVNEKNKDSNHDFDKDALQLYIDNGYLKAKGTTLGADDGCGVVYMLAILDNMKLQHPPLTCVFTVQEEVGLLGAMNIEATDIRATRMIGLDSGDENNVCISSSGGCNAQITKYIAFGSNSKPTYLMTVKGLRGGHSGGEIDKERGNANKLAVRAMYHLLKNDIDVNIVDINGGLKDNAIPRECQIIFNSATPLSKIEEIIQQVQNDVRDELAFSDKEVAFTITEYQKIVNAINDKASKEIIDMLYLAPNGFRNKSMAIKGLTTVSLNMGIVKIEDNHLNVIFSIRSPMESARKELANELTCLSEIFNCECVITGDYPGWQYDENSILRKQWIAYIEKTEGITLKSEASHGGLETGIFKGKIPALDIITMGPNMYDIHTPKECLELASFEKCYNRLVNFLATL